MKSQEHLVVQDTSALVRTKLLEHNVAPENTVLRQRNLWRPIVEPDIIVQARPIQREQIVDLAISVLAPATPQELAAELENIALLPTKPLQQIAVLDIIVLVQLILLEQIVDLASIVRRIQCRLLSAATLEQPPLAQQQHHVPLAVRISIRILLVKAAATPVRWVLEQTASLARLLCQTVSVNLATILQLEALLVLRVPPASTSTPLLRLRPKIVVRENTAPVHP
jgi:hypothetical protein